MNVSIGISNHHVHLNREDFFLLFGDIEMVNVRNINQVGQFVSNLKVDILCEGKELEGLKVLGPCRDYTQVELLNSDAIYFDVNVPIRKSGDLIDSTLLTIIGPNGSITKKCGIIADRHLHITEEERIRRGIKSDVVSLKIGGNVIDNVHVRVAPNSYYEVHLDKDDGNKFDINNGDIAEIIE